MDLFHPEGCGFQRMTRLPPYIFGIVNQLKMEARIRQAVQGIKRALK